MVAAAMDPAGNRNLLTDQLFIDLAAVVRTHGNPGLSEERAAMLPGCWRRRKG
jgi:hypothetical protein